MPNGKTQVRSSHEGSDLVGILVNDMTIQVQTPKGLREDSV